MKVSIITSCYNREATIRGAIESVLEQDYPDIAVSYTHLRAHETGRNLVCRLLLEKKKKQKIKEKKKKDKSTDGELRKCSIQSE